MFPKRRKFPRKFLRAIFQDVLEKHNLSVEVRGVGKFGEGIDHFCANGLEGLKGQWKDLLRSNRQGSRDLSFTVVARQQIHYKKKEHPLPDDKLWVTCLWADIDKR